MTIDNRSDAERAMAAHAASRNHQAQQQQQQVSGSRGEQSGSNASGGRHTEQINAAKQRSAALLRDAADLVAERTSISQGSVSSKRSD